MKREDLEERTFGTIIASSDFPFYAAPEADAVMDAMEARIKELESMLKDKDGIMGTCRGLIESANVMHKDAEDKLLNCIKKLEAKASEDYISYQRKVQKQAKRIAELESENARLNAEIAKLKEEQRWRKFPDEKPSEEGYYIICGSSGFRHADKWTYCKDRQKMDFSFYSYGVAYWMPLPPPPTTDEASATEKERK